MSILCNIHFQNQPNVTPTPGSPTSRLLLEYEMHLRNTLAKGMDAESYSLHTFEALLSQSMENLGNLIITQFARSIDIFLIIISFLWYFEIFYHFECWC